MSYEIKKKYTCDHCGKDEEILFPRQDLINNSDGPEGWGKLTIGNEIKDVCDECMENFNSFFEVE